MLINIKSQFSLGPKPARCIIVSILNLLNNFLVNFLLLISPLMNLVFLLIKILLPVDKLSKINTSLVFF